VFHTLRAVFGRRRPDPAQLSFDLEAPPHNSDELLGRLRALGLKRIARCHLTRNRNVMVSFRGRDLRVHEGYLTAPTEVHQAIVAFVEGRTRAERRIAQRRIVSFRVETPKGPSRRERMRPEDRLLVLKLAEWHGRLNAEHFGGTLKTIPVRISRRMRSRLGHYSSANSAEGGEIAVSLRHLRRHGWEEALHTLLHEMVHQWQDENGHVLDHGPLFRAKAREVGIQAAAKRVVTRG
jgi:hypothetical protein